MPNIIVYTCVTNDYDWVLPPVWRSLNIKFILFTDNPKTKVKGWEVRLLPSVPGLSSGNLANRYCKFFPWRILPEHDWSIYIDANVRLLADPTPIINDAEHRGFDIALFTHPNRSNIWQEAEACKKLCKISGEEWESLDKQLQRYRNKGFSSKSGLTENNVIFRSRESMQLVSAMELWWEELLGGVKRDQISLPYVLWTLKKPVHRLLFSAKNRNPYFRVVSHRQGKSLSNYLEARRYHSAGWKGLYLAKWMVSGVKRRMLKKLYK